MALPFFVDRTISHHGPNLWQLSCCIGTPGFGDRSERIQGFPSPLFLFMLFGRVMNTRHAVLYAKPGRSNSRGKPVAAVVSGRVKKLLQYCFGEKGPVWKKRGRKAPFVCGLRVINAGMPENRLWTVIKTVFSDAIM